MENIIYLSKQKISALKIDVSFLKYQLGMEGYGIYMELKERIEKSGGKITMKNVEKISKEIGVTDFKIKSVLMDYSLFDIKTMPF